MATAACMFCDCIMQTNTDRHLYSSSGHHRLIKINWQCLWQEQKH